MAIYILLQSGSNSVSPPKARRVCRPSQAPFSGSSAPASHKFALLFPGYPRRLISLIVLPITSSWGLRCVYLAPALEPVSSSPAEAYRCKCPPLRVNSDASVRFLSWLRSLPASHCILPPLA
ncbi:hypothetical protein E4T39_04298 [Aureobasidium subglaciale]|nr:hypothetical protein E4T39_04298 [Aureobasidium subglaciale]